MEPEPTRSSARQQARRETDKNHFSKSARSYNIHARSVQHFYSAHRSTILEALQGPHRQDTREAIVVEVQNMLTYGVGHYLHWRDVPPSLRGNILHSFMFIKTKNRPDGTYDRTRARLVCNGAQQKDHMFDLISSATVGLTSVFIAFNIATYFKCKIRTYDIVAAFLHAQFQPRDAVTYIKINKEITAIWITIDPTAQPFIDSKGELLLQLDKFIYGLKQAPVKWQELLNTVLTKLGYRQLIHDDCVMIRNSGRDFSMICLHVDDILLVSNTDYMYDDLTKGLSSHFGTPTSSDKETAYIGMTIEQSANRDTIKLSQQDLVSKIQARYPSKSAHKISSPTDEDFLLEAPHKSALGALTNQTEFLSIVMQLMYLARLTRPDILLPVTNSSLPGLTRLQSKT
jgi:hypothetical protein